MIERWTHEALDAVALLGFPGFTKVEVVEVEHYSVLVEVERNGDAEAYIEVNATAYGDTFHRIWKE